MFTKIIVVTTALFGIGLFFFLIALIPDAKATIVHVSGYGDSAQNDRPGFLLHAACSEIAWPNYDASCLFDMRPGSNVRKIRIVDNR